MENDIKELRKGNIQLLLLNELYKNKIKSLIEDESIINEKITVEYYSKVINIYKLKEGLNDIYLTFNKVYIVNSYKDVKIFDMLNEKDRDDLLYRMDITYIVSLEIGYLIKNLYYDN